MSILPRVKPYKSTLMKKELTIFYTDDDLDDLDFFRDIVDGLGQQYNVVTQNNGEQLIDALHNPPPHPYLIFLDINMPGMNGLETLKKVRQNHKNDLLPIIMFSTTSDETIIENARKLGATFFVIKSGDFDALKRSITHVLSMNWGDFITTDKNFLYNS